MLIRRFSLVSVVSLLLASVACGGSESAPDTNATPAASNTAGEIANAAAYNGPLKISLAQWSLHKRYQAEGDITGPASNDPYDFPKHAKAMGFDGVEYVSQLYKDDVAEGAEHGKSVMAIMSRLDAAAKEAGIEEVLIMIDGEGELADPDAAARQRAVELHKHWVDGAWASGIPTIRVNAGGNSVYKKISKQEAHSNAVESLRALGQYAAPKNVNVVVENHGGYSSDPVWLRDVMAAVDLDNVGILPDFGNFCRDGWPGDCRQSVPADSIYAAVGMWMPYAHAVSAKSYSFDGDGNENKIDYARMLDTVRAHGYDGFVGVEFEGEDLSEEEGIAATMALLKRN